MITKDARALQAEIDRLTIAKNKALDIADERSKENVGLRAALRWIDQYEPALVKVCEQKYGFRLGDNEQKERP